MTNKPRRVARYIRVSTTDQNPQLQADETAHMTAGRGWELVDSYVDHGISGSNDQRPELKRLLADARKGKLDTVLVWRSDRLFRSLKHMVVTIDALAALGVDFVSVSEPFDTTTPQGRLLLHLVAAMGEFERELIRERTRAGLAAARRRGARVGRPPVHIDLVKARSLRAEGKSLREVAKRLGVGATTLRRALASGAPKPSSNGAGQATEIMVPEMAS